MKTYLDFKIKALDQDRSTMFPCLICNDKIYVMSRSAAFRMEMKFDAEMRWECECEWEGRVM